VRSDAVDPGVQYVPGTSAALRMRSVLDVELLSTKRLA